MIFSLNCHHFLKYGLLLYSKFGAILIYQNEAADHLLSPHIKLFKKTKRSGTSLPVSLSEFKNNCFIAHAFLSSKHKQII